MGPTAELWADFSTKSQKNNLMIIFARVTTPERKICERVRFSRLSSSKNSNSIPFLHKMSG